MFVFCLERGVKTKKILRFYFCADSLERALDNLINIKSLDLEGDALETANRLCSVIGDKISLEGLWGYLDSVLSTFSDGEKEVLKNYSARRENPLSESEAREAKRVLIKFTRRARRLGEFIEEIEVLNRYYCLLVCV